MRKIFLYTILGLASVGSIAGCGAFRGSREPCRISKGVPGNRSTCQFVQPRSPSVPRNEGIRGIAWFETDLDNPAPLVPQTGLSAQPLQKVGPHSDRVQSSTSVPFEIVNQSPTTPPAVVQTISVAAAEQEKTLPFQSIKGQVQQFRNTWRLRYAAIDQQDPYGGVVVLEGMDALKTLRDGQHVRATGTLVPPTSRTGSAVYRVDSIEIQD